MNNPLFDFYILIYCTALHIVVRTLILLAKDLGMVSSKQTDLFEKAWYQGYDNYSAKVLTAHTQID